VPGGSDLNTGRALPLLAILVAASLVACGHSSPPAPTLPAVTTTTLPIEAAGHGTVILGGQVEPFTVSSCVDGPSPTTTPDATEQFRLSGAGQVGTFSFTVSVTRYESDSGAGTTTFTETAAVADRSGSSDIEARRTSINGTWLDLNDPTAKTPLITHSGSLVTVEAKFGPQDSRAGDAGIVSGILVARCPAG
jgi:hypothetical protein